MRTRSIIKRIMAWVLIAVMLFGDNTLAFASENIDNPNEEALVAASAQPEAAPAPQPETQPETQPQPQTQAPETQAPETQAPETAAPETTAPETQAPETAAPETSAQETKAPETQTQQNSQQEETQSQLSAETQAQEQESQSGENETTKPEISTESSSETSIRKNKVTFEVTTETAVGTQTAAANVTIKVDGKPIAGSTGEATEGKIIFTVETDNNTEIEHVLVDRTSEARTTGNDNEYIIEGILTDNTVVSIYLKSFETETEEESETETEVSYKNGTLKYEGGKETSKTEDDFTVVMDYTAAAEIPADAKLKVTEIKDNKANPNSKEKKDYDEYLTKTQNALGQTSTEDRKATKARFFNIEILDAKGEVLEPSAEVKVKITFGTPENIIDPKATDIVHFKEEETTKPEVLQATTTEKKATEESTVQFKTDSFSVYGVVYTVEFHFNGGEYIIRGGDYFYLSTMIKALELTKNTDNETFTVDEVEGVTFSDPSLVGVTRETNPKTGKQDYKISSLAPFTSNESLTLKLKNDAEVVVKVTDAQTPDFGEYITGSIVQKYDASGDWMDATTFNDGDKIRVQLSYSLVAGLITPNNKSVSYQIPAGLTLKGAEAGDIKNSAGKAVGSYIITKDGLITLSFTDDFAADGLGIDGTIQFTGNASNENVGSEKVIDFGGDGGSITIVHEEGDKYDIDTSKVGTIDEDNNKASYKVTITTNQGTEGTVDLTDEFRNNGGNNMTASYDHNSFKVVKFDASGKQTAVNAGQYKLTWSGESKFDLTGLPKLGAGERYEVSYDANIKVADKNASGYLQNAAHSTSGKKDDWEYNSVSIDKMIDKSGYYDSNTGLINWTITLNKTKKKDIRAWSFKDKLPAPISGDVKVEMWDTTGKYNEHVMTDRDGQTSLDLEAWYFKWLAGGEEADYTKCTNTTAYIMYATKAPEGAPGTTFNAENTVEGGPGKEKQTATASVSGIHRDWAIYKTHANEAAQIGDNAKRTETWNATVTLPEGNLSTFTFEDTFTDVVNQDGKTIAGTHYSTAAELEKDFHDSTNNSNDVGNCLRINLGGGRYYVYHGREGTVYVDNNSTTPTSDVQFKITYYDENGRTVNSGDGFTPVKRFKIDVIVAPGASVSGMTLQTSNYRTTMDTNQMGDGDTWTVKNTASTKGKESTSSYVYEKPPIFEKFVATAVGDGWATYKSGDSNGVEYDQEDGILRYRLILNTTEADNGQDLIITDTLPSGQKFVANTVEGYYFGNESYVSDTNWNGFTFVKGQNPTYEIKENADGSETLRIVIHKFGYSSQLPRVVVYYKVDIKDDKAWGDPFVENRLYTNRAEWEGHGTTSNGANVHRKVEELTKDSVQLDRDGNPLTEATKDKASGTIRYYVTINPQAKDLDESHDTLTLVDELSASKYNPQLKLDSMKVYSYEAFAPYHVGAELPSSSYSLTYDAANAKFEITVPDEKAMILIYDYQLDEKFGDGSKISNKIKLDNNWEKTEETRLIQADSAATANKAKVEIYKVDSKNYMKKLPGTVFEMKSWKQSKWLDLGYPTYTTDEDGKIQFDLTGPTKTIEYDTLYRLGEKSAPKGYTPESKWTYIIVKSKGETNEQAFAKANAATANDVNKSDGSKVKMEDVTFFEQKGGIVYIENEYNELKVRKVWTDPNGAVTAPPANTEISVKLVQWTTKPDGYKVTVNNMDTRTTRRLSDQGYGTTSFYVKKGSPITFRVSNYKAYAAEIDIPEMSVSTKMNFTTANGANTATYTVSAVNSDLTVNMFAMQEHNYTDGIAENYVEAPDALDARRGYTEKVLNAANNWEFSWTGLPKVNDAGKPVLYTVEEQKVLQNGVDIKNRYGVTYTNNNGSLTGDIVITNKATRDLTQFVFIKRWLKDNGEPAGINWPFNQKIHVKLGRTLNNRVDTSFNLEYDIELVGVSGTPSIQCTTPGVVNGIGQVPKLDRAYDGSDFKFVITGLDKNEATETTAYNYFISETSAEGYDTPQYSVPNSRDAYAGWTQTYDHGTIINTPLTKVEFAKEWADASGKVINAPVGATATFQLYANGQPMADKIITLDGATDINGEFVGWSGRFENLHKRDSNGKDILYTVREITSFLGYSAEEDASFENGWKITNKPDQPTDTEISVTKIWKDSKGNLISNEELTRKNVAATFRLARYQEGSKSEDKEVNGWNRQKVTLYASEADDHNWSYTWTKLPRNYLGSDGEMHTYTYKVKEIGVEYSGDTAGVNTKSGKFVDKLGMWTITFKETDEVIENGEIKAPASSEITNQLNGTKVSFTKQWLNASSSQTEWAKDKQGKEIPITVTLKRYIDGAEDSKFTEKAITYTVNSNGLETAAGSTSGSMTAQKYPLIVTSGKGTGRVTFEINDLPRTDPDKGVTYEYRLVESEVEGYKTTYLDKDNKDVTANGYVKDGETIQNKQNPAVQLPSTGGTGTSRYIGSGMVLLMAALLFLYINNKNRIWKEEH